MAEKEHGRKGRLGGSDGGPGEMLKTRGRSGGISEMTGLGD